MRPKKEHTLTGPTNETIVFSRDKTKLKQDFKLLTLTPGFQEVVDKIRKTYNINPDEEALAETDLNFLKPIKNILKRNGHNIGHEWDYVLSVYVCKNKFEPLGDPYGIKVRIQKNKKSAWLKINNRNTLEEVERASSKVFKVIKSKKTRERPAKEFNRDSLILELKNKGKSTKEIEDTLLRNSFGTVSSFDINRLANKTRKRKKRAL